MTDFSTWDRATLEQFAREATDKLVANRAAIDELVGALKVIVDTFGPTESGAFKGLDAARAVITKHSTTTTTKEEN